MAEMLTKRCVPGYRRVRPVVNSSCLQLSEEKHEVPSDLFELEAKDTGELYISRPAPLARSAEQAAPAIDAAANGF
jgi:hypothetical protein